MSALVMSVMFGIMIWLSIQSIMYIDEPEILNLEQWWIKHHPTVTLGDLSDEEFDELVEQYNDYLRRL